jgi:hypothetical protein
MTVLVLAAAGVIAGASAGRSPVIRVTLHAVNHSGQSGVAMLAPIHGGFRVVIHVAGARIEAGEHDHIHNVSCSRYGRIARHPYAPTAAQVEKQLATVAIGLNDIEGGRSTTDVHAPLTQVTRGGFSINVHETASPYTALACGDIPRS